MARKIYDELERASGRIIFPGTSSFVHLDVRTPGGVAAFTGPNVDDDSSPIVEGQHIGDAGGYRISAGELKSSFFGLIVARHFLWYTTNHKVKPEIILGIANMLEKSGHLLLPVIYKPREMDEIAKKLSMAAGDGFVVSKINFREISDKPNYSLGSNESTGAFLITRL